MEVYSEYLDDKVGFDIVELGNEQVQVDIEFEIELDNHLVHLNDSLVFRSLLDLDLESSCDCNWNCLVESELEEVFEDSNLRVQLKIGLRL